LATGRGRGIWLFRRRSARSGHCYRRKTDAVRPPHWSGTKHTSGTGADGGFSDAADRAGSFFAKGPASAILRRQHALENARSGRSLGKDQPGFIAAELRIAGVRWKIRSE